MPMKITAKFISSQNNIWTKLKTYYKKLKIMVDRYTTIVYYITRAKHKRAHNLIHAIVA